MRPVDVEMHEGAVTANPRRGVLLSAGIAYATVAWGQLNLIAPVVSMFFLISYGLLNYATYYEAGSQSPSFRPRFRYFNKWLSLAGAVACLGVMLAIDIAAGTIAVAVLFGILQYLRRTAGPVRWADSRRSHHLQRIRPGFIPAQPAWYNCLLESNILLFGRSGQFVDKTVSALFSNRWGDGQHDRFGKDKSTGSGYIVTHTLFIHLQMGQ